MENTNNVASTVRPTGEILADAKRICAGIKAGWPQVTGLCVELIEHCNNNSGDVTTIGKVYNMLIDADHKSISNAYASLMRLACFATFKAVEEGTGKYHASQSAKYKKEVTAEMQKEAIERIKSAPDALKKFKPVKKASDTKKASRLFGAAESCDLAINALLSCPDTASQGEDFKKRFMALYGEVDAAIKENAAQHKDIANTLKAMTRATMSAISKATEKEAA